MRQDRLEQLNKALAEERTHPPLNQMIKTCFSATCRALTKYQKACASFPAVAAAASPDPLVAVPVVAVALEAPFG